MLGRKGENGWVDERLMSGLISLLWPTGNRLDSESVHKCTCWTAFNIWEDIHMRQQVRECGRMWWWGLWNLMLARGRMSQWTISSLHCHWQINWLVNKQFWSHHEQSETGALSLCAKFSTYTVMVEYKSAEECQEDGNKKRTVDCYALQPNKGMPKCQASERYQICVNC